jgi:REP element-mobilizing transposase RayT
MDYKLKKQYRLPDYDYSEIGYYFVTICTKGKKCCFGDVVERKVRLSGIGEVVKKYWLEIPEHFEDVRVDEWVVMPNHVHGIIVIEKHKCRNETWYASRRNMINHVPTNHGIKNNPMKLGAISLGRIIRWFKGRVKYEVGKLSNQKHFAWQSRFYDHVIRNEKSLGEIREYIRNNPMKWELDRENLENLFM